MPRDVARDLGIADAQLVEMPPSRTAGGEELRTWRSTVPLTLRVAADQVGTGTAAFGADLRLHGLVGENPNLLLGQADFFAGFIVSFYGNEAPPFVVLEV